MSTCVVFTSRRWAESDGDPGAPDTVGGVPVVARLRQRADRPGALCRLEDDRYAITDDLVAVGSASQLLWSIRARHSAATTAAERTWLADIRADLERRGAIRRLTATWRPTNANMRGHTV